MKINKLGQRINIDNRGKLGRAGGFGRISFGYNTFGLYSFFYGIYKLHATKGHKELNKTRFYRPTNPNSEKQQYWRTCYKNGIIAWQHLHPSAKLKCNNAAKKFSYSGFNLYLKKYLINCRTHL